MRLMSGCGLMGIRALPPSEILSKLTENSAKRGPDPPSGSQSKRKKSERKNGHPNITGTGHYYAAEMFANHAARLHVFGLVIAGDILYLWRYDRQGIIQCSGFNFILDLPRFLVLLLVMQRFENQHWGLNPHIDPDFGHRPGYHVASLRSMNDPGEDDISITLELSLADQRHIPHFGLDGRAPNMFSAKTRSRSLSDKEDDLVVKVFWPEVVRMSEPDIFRRVYSIAEHDDDVKGHVPEFLWHKLFEDASTVRIRERLGLKTQGARVLHMIVFRRLRPITELVGDKFLHASDWCLVYSMKILRILVLHEQNCHHLVFLQVSNLNSLA